MKRLNWSQSVLEGLQDFLHVLTPDRRILYASPSCKAVTGFERDQLEGRFVSAFIHPDDYELFINALNESVSCRSSVRFVYRFRKADWEWAVLESCGHAHVSNDLGPTWLPQHQNIYRGFFIMARPYLSNNRTLFDSILEHNVENERLLDRKAALEYEGRADQADKGQEWEKTEDNSFITHFEARTCIDNDSLGVANRMASPRTTAIASSQMVGAGHPVHNKVHDARVRHTTLSFRGDAGIQIFMHGDSRARLAKTKMRKEKQRAPISEPYVCSHCGTLVSPEWRKGPDGPKTLCNACGLRWSKEKRKSCPERKTGLIP